MTVSVRLYARYDFSGGNALQNVRNKSFTRRLNEAGVGTFEIQASGIVAPDLIDRRTVAVFNDDDAAGGAFAPMFEMFIDDIEQTHASDNQESWLKVSGKGVLSMLEEAVIYPAEYPGAHNTPPTKAGNYLPIQKKVPFNYTGFPYTERTGWAAAGDYLGVGGSPWTGVTPFPVSTARWIWEPPTAGFPNATVAKPRGTVHFRRTYTLATSARVVIYAACDNFARVYLDGQEVLTTPEFTNTANDVAKVELDMTAGDHLFAVEARNSGTVDGPAGLLFGMTTVAGTVLLRSDGTWRCLAYPATFPGMTVDEIMGWLIDRAAARYVWAVGDFTHIPTLEPFVAAEWATDADGQPWPLIDVTADVGQTYWEFLSTLLGLYCDVDLIHSPNYAPTSNRYALRFYLPGTLGLNPSGVKVESPEPATLDRFGQPVPAHTGNALKVTEVGPR